MKKKIEKTIHVVNEKYFLGLLLLFIILFIVFPEKSEIILPLGIGSLTFYYFISYNSNCPKCDKPFAKIKLGSKQVRHNAMFSEKDMDPIDSTFHVRRTEYKCKYCKHSWAEEKKYRFHS